MGTIREVFDRLGKSSSEVSEASGIEQARLAELTRGAEPTLAELRDLALTLGIPLSDFLPATGRQQETALLTP